MILINACQRQRLRGFIICRDGSGTNREPEPIPIWLWKLDKGTNLSAVFTLFLQKRALIRIVSLHKSINVSFKFLFEPQRVRT